MSSLYFLSLFFGFLAKGFLLLSIPREQGKTLRASRQACQAFQG
jgi:hypothetical protein